MPISGRGSSLTPTSSATGAAARRFRGSASPGRRGAGCCGEPPGDVAVAREDAEGVTEVHAVGAFLEGVGEGGLAAGEEHPAEVGGRAGRCGGDACWMRRPSTASTTVSAETVGGRAERGPRVRASACPGGSSARARVHGVDAGGRVVGVRGIQVVGGVVAGAGAGVGAGVVVGVVAGVGVVVGVVAGGGWCRPGRPRAPRRSVAAGLGTSCCAGRRARGRASTGERVAPAS